MVYPDRGGPAAPVNQESNMTTKQRRTVRYSTDHDGESIVLIPLANQPASAKVLVAVFRAIIEAGYSDQWTFNDNGKGQAYVRCGDSRTRGNLATVARVIMEPPKGYQVRYRDGDRMNLRRDNLRLEKKVRARSKKYPNPEDDRPAGEGAGVAIRPAPSPQQQPAPQ